MREAFTFLYSRLFVESLLIIGIVALFVGRLRRRLRVTPDQTTRAPILWLVNITADARLHRRLRRLAGRARAVGRGGVRHRRRRGRTQSQRLAEDIEGALIDLDERLVGSTKFDFDAQRIAIRAIRADAQRIDDLIDRVAVLIEREASDPSATLAADPVGELMSRVDQIEQAATADAAAVIETSAHADPVAAITTTLSDTQTAEPLDSPA